MRHDTPRLEELQQPSDEEGVVVDEARGSGGTFSVASREATCVSVVELGADEGRSTRGSCQVLRGLPPQR